MKTLRSLLPLAVLAAGAFAQARPSPLGGVCGYQYSVENDTPVNGEWPQIQHAVATNVSLVTYDTGVSAYAAVRGSLLIWSTYNRDPSLAGSVLSTPYLPIFNINTFSASRPPTPWVVPTSVPGADKFFLDEFSLMIPPQWATDGFGIGGISSLIPVYYNTLDIPNNTVFVGIEFMTQYVRYSNFQFLWSAPWLVRIV